MNLNNPTSKIRYNVPIQQVPQYMITKNIIRGYRVGGTYKECFLSNFRLHDLHNEAVNAWTMVVSSLIVFFSSTWFIKEFELELEKSIAFIVFVLAYWLHLPFSFCYHTFMPISARVSGLWRNLDVCAIFIRATMLTFAMSYFVLPIWGILVNVFISMSIGIWGISRFLKQPIHQPLNKFYQALFIGSSVGCHVFPFYFAFLNDFIELGMDCISLTNSFWLFCGISLSILIGGVCYALGIPERFSPGTFDLLLNSHIISHIGIIFCSVFEFLFLASNCFKSNNHYLI